MVYYNKKKYELLGYERATREGKMYNAVLRDRTTLRFVRVPFGSTTYGNYKDITGLNYYPHLIHGDKERRRLFRLRNKHNLRDGFYSPSWFSHYILW